MASRSVTHENQRQVLEGTEVAVLGQAVGVSPGALTSLISIGVNGVNFFNWDGVCVWKDASIPWMKLCVL